MHYGRYFFLSLIYNMLEKILILFNAMLVNSSFPPFFPLFLKSEICIYELRSKHSNKNNKSLIQDL